MFPKSVNVPAGSPSPKERGYWGLEATPDEVEGPVCEFTAVAAVDVASETEFVVVVDCAPGAEIVVAADCDPVAEFVVAADCVPDNATVGDEYCAGEPKFVGTFEVEESPGSIVCVNVCVMVDCIITTVGASVTVNGFPS